MCICVYTHILRLAIDLDIDSEYCSQSREKQKLKGTTAGESFRVPPLRVLSRVKLHPKLSSLEKPHKATAGNETEAPLCMHIRIQLCIIYICI